jgi:hypothetical protein
MALGTGLAEVQQHATGQHQKTTHSSATSKSIVADESSQEDSEHEEPYSWPSIRKHNRDIGTDTAYAEDTDIMVSEVLTPVLPYT